MRVTSKGQVTIPIAIRQKYGIAAGANVEFVGTEGGLLLRVRGESGEERARRIVARLSGSATSGLTTDEIMRMMRGTGEPDPGFDEPADAATPEEANHASDQQGPGDHPDRRTTPVRD